MGHWKNAWRRSIAWAMVLAISAVLSSATFADAQRSGMNNRGGNGNHNGWGRGGGRGGGHGVPELDPGVAAGATIIIVAGALIAADRIRKKKQEG